MTELVKVTMPRLGESVAEGTLVKWLVKPGTKVAAFDVIAEIDTDKVSAEIPAPADGVIRELLAKEGDAVKVGASIAMIEASEAIAPANQSIPATPAVTTSIGASGSPVRERHAHSPAVRDLARQHGIDVTTLEGTGSEGRVTRADVLRALDQRRAPANTTPSSDESDEVVPLTRIRKLIAESMALSKRTIPHAWQSQEVDMTAVVEHRKANKAQFERDEGFALTYLPYVIAAAVGALRLHPYANATFTPEGIVLHRSINIGVAVGLEDGVVVPVVRGAHRLSFIELARAINDLAGRARSKKLRPDDLAEGTFTVNNSGTFGTVVSYSVISPGQAGILTMGAIKDRVVVAAGQIAIRPMMFLSFSLDHRILDGLAGARFLTTCRELLESARV